MSARERRGRSVLPHLRNPPTRWRARRADPLHGLRGAKCARGRLLPLVRLRVERRSRHPGVPYPHGPPAAPAAPRGVHRHHRSHLLDLHQALLAVRLDFRDIADTRRDRPPRIARTRASKLRKPTRRLGRPPDHRVRHIQRVSTSSQARRSSTEFADTSSDAPSS